MKRQRVLASLQKEAFARYSTYLYSAYRGGSRFEPLLLSWSPSTWERQHLGLGSRDARFGLSRLLFGLGPYRLIASPKPPLQGPPQKIYDLK